MPLVPAKCPNCGGNVVVDNEKDACICDFCKTPFIVEKAINNFNTITNVTNNVTNNNDIKADVVNVYENKEKDFVIKGGILEKYEGDSVNVVIPDTVKIIGENAFKDRLVETIEIPNSVKIIKKGAFYNCSDLYKVNIGDSVETIESCRKNPVSHTSPYYGGGAFEKCSKLKEIILPESLEYIGDNTFSECTSLVEIRMPSKVKYIGQGMFYNCSNLQKLELGDEVDTIGAHAFSGCKSIKHINISNAIHLNGNRTFSDCFALEEVLLPNRVEGESWSEICKWKASFSNCAKLKSIKIPKGVLELSMDSREEHKNPKGVFHGCCDLESVELPDGLKTIVASFDECKSLKKINIPDSLEWISEGCFRDCGLLELVDVDISYDELLRLCVKALVGTPFWEKIATTLDYCPYCGGNFKGIFNKKCSKCGKARL